MPRQQPEVFALPFLPVALALIPLVIAPGLMFYFDVTPKIAVLLIATGLALFQANVNARGISALRSSRLGRWFTYLLAAQCIVIVLATVFSHDLALSIVGGAWRRCGAIVEITVCGFVLLIAARFSYMPATIELTLRLIAVSGLLTAIYGVAQFFGIDPFLPGAPYHAGEGIWTIVRPPSTMGNANYFANYLLYATFASAVLIRRDGGLWTAISASACGLGLIAIVLSGTRSAIAGLAVGLVILIAGSNARLRLWTAGAIASITVLIAILAATPLGQPVKARIRWSREDALGGGRLLLWRDSLNMLASHPLTGFGPDTFGRHFPAFQSVELSRQYPDFYQESPHNTLLDSAVASGVPGLAVAIAMLAFGFYAAWMARAHNPRLALCLTAALAGGAIAGQFAPPTAVTQLYALILIAMLCATQSEQSSVRPLKAVSLVAGITLLLCATALLTSDILAGAFKRSIDDGNVDAAVTRYRTVRDYSLPGFTIDLYASRSFAQLSTKSGPLLTRSLAWRTAVEAGNRAIDTAEDRQNAFLNLAQLYAQQNDVTRTEENIRLASKAAPNWFKPHWILAELLLRTGRVPEAREQARIAWNLDAGKDPEVAQTWQALGSPR